MPSTKLFAGKAPPGVSRIVVVGAVLLSIGLSPAARAADNSRAFVFPPATGPLGWAYRDLAAQWWQWVLSAPGIPPGESGGASANPLVDTTGDACAVGQRGLIWFLAGASGDFGGPTTVTRECTVPAGRILFFPVLNLAYFAFLTDPPDERTIAFIRSHVTGVENTTGLFAEIDGAPVPNIARYLEKSSIFNIILPPGNIFEAFGLGPNFVLSPSADEGYYLAVALPPPPAGSQTARHTLHFGVKNKVDTTYHLTVIAP